MSSIPVQQTTDYPRPYTLRLHNNPRPRTCDPNLYAAWAITSLLSVVSLPGQLCARNAQRSLPQGNSRIKSTTASARTSDRSTLLARSPRPRAAHTGKEGQLFLRDVGHARRAAVWWSALRNIPASFLLSLPNGISAAAVWRSSGSGVVHITASGRDGKSTFFRASRSYRALGEREGDEGAVSGEKSVAQNTSQVRGTEMREASIVSGTVQILPGQPLSQHPGIPARTGSHMQSSRPPCSPSSHLGFLMRLERRCLEKGIED